MAKIGVRLWRREVDGIKLKELCPSMFADMAQFYEALDFAYMRGFSEDYPTGEVYEGEDYANNWSDGDVV